jgi:hypothetical protein
MRSFRELWLWLGGLFLALAPFLAAIAIAYFLKDPRYSLFSNFWMVAAWVSFLVAFGCFFGAIARWRFPPWAKPGFPDIGVQIYGTGLIDTEREAGTGMDVPARLRSFHARFVNSEAEQHASLTVLLYVKLIPGSWGRAGEAACPPPDWTLSPSLSLSPIAMPFALPPGEAMAGHLVYEIPGYYLDKIADPMDARLELLDHVTGKRVSLGAEIGDFDKSQMTASSGGAEVLGPEYEDKAGDAGPALLMLPSAPAEQG